MSAAVMSSLSAAPFSQLHLKYGGKWEFGVLQRERLYGFSHTGVSERVRGGDGERVGGRDALMEAGPMIP